MKGLFRYEAGAAGLALILADGDRSWRHRLNPETTITDEAWHLHHQPNQDWYHACGAAPTS